MLCRSIVCDGCGVVGDESRGGKAAPSHILRYRLRSRGWVLRQPGTPDICPACQKKERGPLVDPMTLKIITQEGIL
jgi:hypothetical protein